MCVCVVYRWHSETLQEYQRRRELLGMARTQASKTKNRLISQDIATFNQSRAENIKVHVLMRDEKEGRKKQARSNKQTTRQSNTAHPRQSLSKKK